MDRITLRDLRISGRHGAYPGERDVEQPFDVRVVADIDLRAAEASDDLGDTLNYDDLRKRITVVVESTSFVLLERLAGEIANELFNDARIAHAAVSIAKPGILDGATAEVTIERDNPRYRRGFP
jgi:dihydroneopterin aldolase